MQIPPPPPVPEPERSEPKATWWARASWPAAIAALAFGVATDLLLRGPVGIGLLVLSLAASAAVIALCRPRLHAVAFFVAATILMAFSAIRSSQILVALDLAAALALFAAGAAFAKEGSPAATGFRGYIVRSLSVGRALPAGVVVPVAPFARAASSGNRVRRLPRLALIVAPVVTIFLVLLGSADAVFAHYLRTSLNAVPATRGLPTQLALIALGAIALATLLVRSASHIPITEGAASPRSGFALTRGEWMLLLGAVDAVFAAFVLVQLTYFFGGTTLVLHQEGLTFAEYARNGFAQLVVAAILTGALIATVWSFGRRENRRDGRTFSWLAGLLVVLTLVVLASAFRRLMLYEGAFGWTWPRLLGHATVVFLAGALTCALAWIARRRGRWLATAVLVTALVTLLGLNVLDPDRFIAQRNIARYDAIGVLDTSELLQLSPDATPTIVHALPYLPHGARKALGSELACQREELAQVSGLGSWNLSRTHALTSLEGVDLGAC